MLQELLQDIHSGDIQLPDFQRGWVWDDERIRDLLVSISRSFPVGAVMTLSADGEIQFQRRLIEGVPANDNSNLGRYLLDGQQRLTSLYQALMYPGPVETRDRPGGNKVIKRRYYLDMQAALNPVGRSRGYHNQRAEGPGRKAEFWQGGSSRSVLNGPGIPESHDANRTDLGQRGLGLRVCPILECT